MIDITLINKGKHITDDDWKHTDRYHETQWKVTSIKFNYMLEVFFDEQSWALIFAQYTPESCWGFSWRDLQDLQTIFRMSIVLLLITPRVCHMWTARQCLSFVDHSWWCSNTHPCCSKYTFRWSLWYLRITRQTCIECASRGYWWFCKVPMVCIEVRMVCFVVFPKHIATRICYTPESRPV